jgi:hypothetical protein
MQPLRLSEAMEENLQTRITRSLQVIQTGYVNYGPNVVNIEFTKKKFQMRSTVYLSPP